MRIVLTIFLMLAPMISLALGFMWVTQTMGGYKARARGTMVKTITSLVTAFIAGLILLLTY